jgi:multiple sugar transport system substrate-binding protein
MNHAQFPIGPVGRSTELALFTQAFIFKYTKYPNAAQEYVRFMWEKEQFEPWQKASLGYVSHALDAYKNNPLWSEDPKALPYRDMVKRMQNHGYAGTLGSASQASIADFIIVNMVAEVASGQRTAKDAMRRAQQRAERYYKA